jgi:hypothetical protein
VSKQSGGVVTIELGSGALFIVFLVLRLTEHIDWAWYWVAGPLWIPAAILIAFVALAAMVAIPIELIADNRRAAKARDAWRQKNGVPKL